MTIQFTKEQQKAALLFDEALNGDVKAQHKFIEGISTSDIPKQLAPMNNLIALNEYDSAPKIWQEWATRLVLPNFEPQQYKQFQWGDEDIEPENAGEKFYNGGLAHIPEYGEYPVLRFTATDQFLTLQKSGVQIKFSWESLIATRDFGLITRTWTEFGRRAAFTEHIEATKPLVKSTGINTDYWNATNQNIVTGNPELSAEALQNAFQQLATQTYNGRRASFVPSGYKLVIPRGLEFTAQGILDVDKVTNTTTDGTTTTVTETGNTLRGKFSIVVNDYLTQIAGSNADKAWFLVPNPGTALNPNIFNAFLQGNETPKIFVEKTTTSAEIDGAFIDDSYSTKTRHVVSGGFLRPEGTIGSSGAGV